MSGKLTYVPSAGGKAVEHWVSQRLTYVGRDKDCAIRVEDDSVDGKQFLISVTDQKVSIQNLSRKSATLVNEVALRVREERELGDSDTISFGNAQFLWTMSACSGKRTPARHDCLKRSRISEPVRKVAVVTPHRREAPTVDDWEQPEKRRRTMFDPAGTPETSGFARRVKYDKMIKERMVNRRRQSASRGTPTPSSMKKKSISFARPMESPQMSYDHQRAFNKSITPGKFYRGNTSPFVFGGFTSVSEDSMSPGLLSGHESFLSVEDYPKNRRSPRVSTPYPNKMLTNTSVSQKTPRSRAPSGVLFPPIHEEIGRAQHGATPPSYFSSTSGSPRMMRAESPVVLPGGSGTQQGRRSVAQSSQSSSYGTPRDSSVDSHNDSMYVNAPSSMQMSFQDFDDSSMNHSPYSWTRKGQTSRSDSFSQTPPLMRTPRRTRGPIESPGSAQFSPNPSEASTSGYVLLSPRGHSIINRAFNRNDMSLQLGSPSPSRRLFGYSPNRADQRSVQPSLSVQVLTKSLKKKLDCSIANSPQHRMATPKSRVKEMRSMQSGLSRAPVTDRTPASATPKSSRSLGSKRISTRQSSEPDLSRLSRKSDPRTPTSVDMNETKSSAKGTTDRSSGKNETSDSPLGNVTPRLSRRSSGTTPRQSSEPDLSRSRKSGEIVQSPINSGRISTRSSLTSSMEKDLTRGPASKRKAAKSLSAESVVVNQVASMRSSLPASLDRSSRRRAPIQLKSDDVSVDTTPATEVAPRKSTPRSVQRQETGSPRTSGLDTSRLSRSTIQSGVKKTPLRNTTPLPSPRSKVSLGASPQQSSEPRSSRKQKAPQTPLLESSASHLPSDTETASSSNLKRRSFKTLTGDSRQNENASLTGIEGVSPVKNSPPKSENKMSSLKMSLKQLHSPKVPLITWKRQMAKSLSADSPVVNKVSSTRNSLPPTLGRSTGKTPPQSSAERAKVKTPDPKRRSRASLIGEAAHLFDADSPPSSTKSSTATLPVINISPATPLRLSEKPSSRSSRGSRRPSLTAVPHGIRKSSGGKKSIPSRSPDETAPSTPPRSAEPEIVMRSSRKSPAVRQIVTPPTPTSALRRNARRSVKKSSIPSITKRLSLVSPRRDTAVKKLTLDPEKPDKNKMAALIACHKKKSPTKENRPSASFSDGKSSPKGVPDILTPLKDLDAQPEERSPEDQLLDALDLSRKSSVVTEPKKPSRRLRSSTSLRLSASAAVSFSAPSTVALPASATKTVKKLLFKTPLVEYEGSQSQSVEVSSPRTIKGILSPSPTTSSEEPMNRVFTTSPVVDFTDIGGRKKIFVASPNSKSKAGGIRELVPTDETDLNIWTLFESSDSNSGSSAKKRKGSHTPSTSSAKKARTPRNLESLSPPRSTKRNRAEDLGEILSGKRNRKVAEESSKKAVEPAKKSSRKAAAPKTAKSAPPVQATPPTTSNKKGKSSKVSPKKKVAANEKPASKVVKNATGKKSPSPSKSPKPSGKTKRNSVTGAKRRPLAGKPGTAPKTFASGAKPKKAAAKPTKSKSKTSIPGIKSPVQNRGAKTDKNVILLKIVPKTRAGKGNEAPSATESEAKTRRGVAAAKSTKKVTTEPEPSTSKRAAPSSAKSSKNKKGSPAEDTTKQPSRKGRKPAAASVSKPRIEPEASTSKRAPPSPVKSSKNEKGSPAENTSKKSSRKGRKPGAATSVSKPRIEPEASTSKRAPPSPVKSSKNKKVSPAEKTTKKPSPKGRKPGAATSSSPRKTRGKAANPSPKSTAQKAAGGAAKSRANAVRLSIPPKPLRGKAVGAKAAPNKSPRKSPVKTRSRQAPAPARGKR